MKDQSRQLSFKTWTVCAITSGLLAGALLTTAQVGAQSSDTGSQGAEELAATPAAASAKVYIISPEDRAVVSSPVTVRFGLSGMGVAPAGVEWENTGHHHLILDAPLPPLDDYLPADEHHIHFGGGQTETEIELAPGTHTLQLLFADHEHRPHDPPLYSEKILITVE